MFDKDAKYTEFFSYAQILVSGCYLGDSVARYTVTGLTDGYMSSSNGMDAERANLDMYEYRRLKV
jgi:hypothetical protein